MAVKQILTEPNKLLRKISSSVEKVTDKEQKLMICWIQCMQQME